MGTHGDKRVRCGFCSGDHDTRISKERKLNGERIVPKYQNCLLEHNAWSGRLSAVIEDNTSPTGEGEPGSADPSSVLRNVQAEMADMKAMLT